MLLNDSSNSKYNYKVNNYRAQVSKYVRTFFMASLIMLSTVTAAIPMSNMNMFSTAMASEKDRDDDKRYHYDNNKRYQQSTYEQDRYASSYDLSYSYDTQQPSYDQQPNYGYSSQSSYSDYSEYETHDKKYECRTGPFEGFFVSSVEFCKFKFDDKDRKDHRDNRTGTQGPPGIPRSTRHSRPTRHTRISRCTRF